MSLTPLIMFAASPGAITGVITLSVAHAGTELPVTVRVSVAVALAMGMQFSLTGLKALFAA